MTFEITDHVPGRSDEAVAALATEADAGDDLTGTQLQPKPPPPPPRRSVV